MISCYLHDALEAPLLIFSIKEFLWSSHEERRYSPLTLLLFCVLLIGTLSGCGNGNSTMTASSASTAVVSVCQNGCTYSLNNPPHGGATVNGVSSSVFNGTNYIWALSSYGNTSSTTSGTVTYTIDLTSVNASDPSTNKTFTLTSSLSDSGYYMAFAPDFSGNIWVLINNNDISSTLYESNNNGVTATYTCSISPCFPQSFAFGNSSTIFLVTVPPSGVANPTTLYAVSWGLIYRIDISGKAFHPTKIYSGGGSCNSGSSCWSINGLSTDKTGNVWASGTYNSGNGESAVLEIPQSIAANATGVVPDTSINYYCSNTNSTACQYTNYGSLSFPPSGNNSYFNEGGAVNTPPSKLVIDNKNNIWIGGSNAVELSTNTSPPTAITCQGGSCTGPIYNGSQMIAVSPQNSSSPAPNYPVWVSINNGNSNSTTGSALAGFSSSNSGQNLIDVSYCDFSLLQNSSSMNGCTQYLGFAGNTPQNIAIDTQGNVWMVNGSSSQIVFTEFVSAAN